MRLIDADALKDGIMENINPYLGIYESGEPRCFVREDEVLRYIDDFPTIDPVKHGKWIKDDVGVHCSECFCGWEFLTGIPVEVYEFNYCPNCGAQMEKSEE